MEYLRRMLFNAVDRLNHPDDLWILLTAGSAANHGNNGYDKDYDDNDKNTDHEYPVIPGY